MKKIILVLLVILTSLNFSKNLDKYESKRVFDKYIETLLSGDFEKYKNDPEMTRVMRDSELDKKILEKNLQYIKKNKYEVLEVKEKKKESMLIVKATYNSISELSIDEQWRIFLNKVSEISKEYGIEINDLDREKVIVEVENELMNLSKLETKTIEVYMNKENEKWDFSGEIEDGSLLENVNKDFYITIMLSYELLSYIENLEFE